MTYQSTGEVRLPRKGERHLSGEPDKQAVRYVCATLYDFQTPRVIMEPVPEGECE